MASSEETTPNPESLASPAFRNKVVDVFNTGMEGEYKRYLELERIRQEGESVLRSPTELTMLQGIIAGASAVTLHQTGQEEYVEQQLKVTIDSAASVSGMSGEVLDRERQVGRETLREMLTTPTRGIGGLLGRIDGHHSPFAEALMPAALEIAATRFIAEDSAGQSIAMHYRADALKRAVDTVTNVTQ